MAAVLFISSCVFKYREEYMSHDFRKVRFGILVFLFVLSMVFLIVSPNFIRVILGWDGLGLVSYCLVVYYMNYKSNAAGIITVLTNRLGDSGLIICVSLFLCYGRLEFIRRFFDYRVLSLFIGLGCFLAAVTKRAQVPFSA
jgi:NADH-ubiquinone oxidoreductase chain 5